jgi:hypothetical protein
MYFPFLSGRRLAGHAEKTVEAHSDPTQDINSAFVLLVACRSEFVSMGQRNRLLTRAAQFGVLSRCWSVFEGGGQSGGVTDCIGIIHSSAES